MPSSSALRITIEGDPAVVIVVDPAVVIVVDPAAAAPGSSPAATAPGSGLATAPGAPVSAGEVGLAALRDQAVAASDPSDPAAGPHGRMPEGGPAASPGRPLVRAMPPSPDQPPGTGRLEIVVDGWRFEAVVEPARRAMLRDLARRESGAGGEGPQVVRAPLPGRIVRVWVKAGDAVEPGAPLCSLEAMKMENEIRAARAGTIERVSVETGAHVEHGDELVVIG